MLKHIAAVFIALGLMFGAGSASAASICKGMSVSKCGGTDACYWVKSYKTKKGNNVKAHCRAKPNGGAAQAKDTKKKKKKKKAAAAGNGSGSSSSSSSTSSSSSDNGTTKKKKKKKKKKKQNSGS